MINLNDDSPNLDEVPKDVEMQNDDQIIESTESEPGWLSFTCEMQYSPALEAYHFQILFIKQAVMISILMQTMWQIIQQF